MPDDLYAPIHAICPGCGEPTHDLLAHAPHCSTPSALDIRADVEEEALNIRAAIKEIEFVLTTIAPENASGYVSRLAKLHAELDRLSTPSTCYRRLVEVLRERQLLLER